MEFAIFNDGVPSSVFYGSHPDHDVIRLISDEAIDELFPPSAEEVAEMEAADEFVETMAWLSYLDECDMAARSSFAGYKKRWAARREDGLIGRPHPAKARHQESGTHSVGSETESPTTLVMYAPRNFEMRPRKVDSRVHGASSGVPKNSKGLHGHRAPIQQPRKHY